MSCNQHRYLQHAHSHVYIVWRIRMESNRSVSTSQASSRPPKERHNQTGTSHPSITSAHTLISSPASSPAPLRPSTISAATSRSSSQARITSSLGSLFSSRNRVGASARLHGSDRTTTESTTEQTSSASRENQTTISTSPFPRTRPVNPPRSLPAFFRRDRSSSTAVPQSTEIDNSISTQRPAARARSASGSLSRLADWASRSTTLFSRHEPSQLGGPETSGRRGSLDLISSRRLSSSRSRIRVDSVEEGTSSAHLSLVPVSHSLSLNSQRRPSGYGFFRRDDSEERSSRDDGSGESFFRD